MNAYNQRFTLREMISKGGVFVFYIRYVCTTPLLEELHFHHDLQYCVKGNENRYQKRKDRYLESEGTLQTTFTDRVITILNRLANDTANDMPNCD